MQYNRSRCLTLITVSTLFRGKQKVHIFIRRRLLRKRDNKMKSLAEMMDEQLNRLTNAVEYKTIKEFITNDSKSSGFITAMSDGLSFEMPKEGTSLYTVAQTRARHSAITFLMGMVFRKFGGIYDEIGSFLYNRGDYDDKLEMWLMASLNHDRAYTSELITNPAIILNKKFRYDVLSDGKPETVTFAEFESASSDYSRALAYSYDTIRGYDRYSRQYHTMRSEEGDEVERVDHGILGAYITYNELMKRALKANLIDGAKHEMFKASSLAIAQHNMYKSPDKITDLFYEEAGNLEQLYSTSSYKISMKTPLLLLLCIVDTIECVKRFSKGENPKASLQSLTVLSNINADVSATTIHLDFSNLKKEIQAKKNSDLMKELSKHLHGIVSLKEWTCISTNMDEEECSVVLRI